MNFWDQGVNCLCVKVFSFSIWVAKWANFQPSPLNP